MGKKEALKEIAVIVVTYLVTVIIERTMFDSRFIPNDTVMMDFISWLIVFAIVYTILRLGLYFLTRKK
ncbi:hypothetical protein [Marinilactibacillus kalidii]|uniref:hypothetical protein n=1 Tax=Marinilactibacillus kalidii TaxID=2820274 RepID=UPI001ABEAE01|nr:hypothetical protein [Marinilactibacillus kalidii]